MINILIAQLNQTFNCSKKMSPLEYSQSLFDISQKLASFLQESEMILPLAVQFNPEFYMNTSIVLDSLIFMPGLTFQDLVISTQFKIASNCLPAILYYLILTKQITLQRVKIKDTYVTKYYFLTFLS